MSSSSSKRPALPVWLIATLACTGCLLLTIVGPMVLRAYVVETFKIPAGSMRPTLEMGDYIYVWKGRVEARGEVVVFRFPLDEAKDYVKRIVAAGGDTIEVRQNHIHLNGKPIARRQLVEPCLIAQDGGEASSCVAFEEEIDGRAYRVIQEAVGVPGDFGPFLVPQGYLFVMGDNRDNSHDSRYWGPVPAKNVEGRAARIWWSSGLEGGRWGRVGKRVR